MKKIIVVLSALGLLLAACAPKQPATLTVMTHDSFSVSEEVVQAFETANNVKLVFLPSGDAGAMLNKAILTKEAPLADVLFGVDNTFLSRAIDADIFTAYESPALKDVPAEFQLDPSHRATPIDFGDVCINYDKKYFADNSLAVPQSLAALTQPEYANLLVVQNPATSSTGLAFLLASIAQFGEDGYLDYWRALKANGVVVVDGWETAYYTNFSASSGKGPQPMAVSYGTSPAAEVIFADPPVTEAPTASIVSTGSCFRQIEFAAILKGTQNQVLAEKFIDFMLGVQFQQDMPLQMFVYPVNPNVTLPAAFTQYAQAPAEPATLDPALIAANRDAWIQAWVEVMK